MENSFIEDITVFHKKIHITAKRIDTDLIIEIIGGDRPHIGAITAGNYKHQTQSIVFDIHKEFYFTEEWLIRLRKKFSGNILIYSGVHYSQITNEQLKVLTSKIDNVYSQVEEWLKK
ncbi:hypothetical protein DOK76_03670 [Vagococcus sp. DIV0080]|uniref:Prenylated flavin chaperone LpdD-like domain-containing protein n=1 Tax=Candidatus Vagococcus giribetii TaxID=2230876 RepID=A0ABS3HQX0_9ENTE|nr:hypothetical protein [Vagococcus sp. DIV0080]MBO0476154.1 hypothetical protein [Vagococcus sp. DIV0080]